MYGECVWRARVRLIFRPFQPRKGGGREGGGVTVFVACPLMIERDKEGLIGVVRG